MRRDYLLALLIGERRVRETKGRLFDAGGH
jgi:hypothetical protein